MRSDYARRVKDCNGMNQIMIDIKPNRSVSDVYINQKMDVTKLMEYIKKKKEKGEHITFFHAVVAGVGKVFYNRPYLNRFIQNRHIFEHKYVDISFVAKVAFNEKIQEKVDGIRKNDNIEKNGANGIIDVLAKLPNIIRVPVVGLLKWMDKKGILPRSVCEDNLYYSSIILSNLGTLHSGAILHNITDFGNSSALATIGEIKEEEVLINGKKEVRKLCEFGINLDERIADGYYFVKSIQLLQYIFDHPELLEDRSDATVNTEE